MKKRNPKPERNHDNVIRLFVLRSLALTLLVAIAPAYSQTTSGFVLPNADGSSTHYGDDGEIEYLDADGNIVSDADGNAYTPIGDSAILRSDGLMIERYGDDPGTYVTDEEGDMKHCSRVGEITVCE